MNVRPAIGYFWMSFAVDRECLLERITGILWQSAFAPINMRTGRMRYPELLKPDQTEAIELPSGNIVNVPKTCPQFQAWSGEPILDTYGKKPILDSDGLPAFAEIRILRLFQKDGWIGVWVDTFRRKFRTEFWPKNEIQLPPQEKELLENIYSRAGDRDGCWDVFCWKGADHIWAESKLRGRDSIRAAQVKWLYATLECGLPLSSFLIVEWSLEKVCMDE